MVIALVSNKNWYEYMVVDLYALLEKTKDLKKVYLLTETDNYKDIPYLEKLIKKYPKTEIIVKNANKFINKYLNNDSENKDSYFTDFCMVKLMLSNEINEDKILYLDIDAIAIDDISNIWKYNIDGYYVAGIRDYGILERGTENIKPIEETYINSGVVIFNLKEMRKDKVQEKIFDIINRQLLRYPDQDALNLICHDKTYLLPNMYNVCYDVTAPMFDNSLTKIMHYAGMKQNWVSSMYGSEIWYTIYEKFKNEFGWDEK